MKEENASTRPTQPNATAQQPSTNKAVNPIPEGMHTVTPFIVVNQAAMLMEFIKNAFDGKIRGQMDGEDGKVMHAEMTIGDSHIMISDANEKNAPMPCMLYLYVEDVDSTYQQALKAKGQSLREPTDEFYGDRSAGVKDPWGNQWWMATHVEDVSPEEMKKRANEFQKQEA